MRALGQLWNRLHSGLWVPAAKISRSSIAASDSYEAVKENARALQSLYLEKGVRLSPRSSLARMIDNGCRVADLWEKGERDSIVDSDLLDLLDLCRITDAVLPLASEATAPQYLSRLLKGELRHFHREESEAKDILWELEFRALLVRRGFAVALEEPDVQIDIEGQIIGIACKKIYSEKNFETRLSRGVHQAEKYDLAIVAVNVDDIDMPAKLLDQTRREDALAFLNSKCHSFINRQDRHVRKYLSTGRLMSVIVSTGAVANLVDDQQPLLTTMREVVGWQYPATSPKMAYYYDRFRTQLGLHK